MTKSPKIKIFVAHHKPGLIYEDDIFIPIQVGKKNSKFDLGILGDNTGDNISEKNSGYCELTAQYWVRKNYDLTDVDYIGFCHYRRYMTYKYTPNPFSPSNAFKKDKNLYRSIIYFFYYLIGIEYEVNFSENIIKDSSNHIKNYIAENKSDIYLPKRWVDRGPYHHLGIQNNKAREIMDNIFSKNFPQYYKIFNRINNNLLCSFGNMFIMKKELFLEYEKRQFELLFEFEKELRKKGLSDEVIANGNRGIDTRVMGFISERFPCIFAEYQKKIHKKSINFDSNLLFFY